MSARAWGRKAGSAWCTYCSDTLRSPEVLFLLLNESADEARVSLVMTVDGEEGGALFRRKRWAGSCGSFHRIPGRHILPDALPCGLPVGWTCPWGQPLNRG